MSFAISATVSFLFSALRGQSQQRVAASAVSAFVLLTDHVHIIAQSVLVDDLIVLACDRRKMRHFLGGEFPLQCAERHALTGGIARRARHTLYAVTETRALILTDGKRGTDCMEYVFSRLSGVMLRSVRDGSGTIEMISPESLYLRSFNYSATRRTRLAGGTFEMIADVDRVYQLISARISGNAGKPDIPV